MLLAQGRRALDADASAKAKQPVAQVHIALDGPARQIQLHGIGMAVGGATGLEHVRRFGVVPPGIASQRFAVAGVLDRVALQALADEGKAPALAAEAQGGERLLAHLGRGAAELQLRLVVVAEVDAAAEVQQGLQSRQGLGVGVDYGNGWTDWIYVGPEGFSHAAWQPGQNRGSVPFNFGPAVKLSGIEADVVGVYSFAPAQTELKPYTAVLLSNGQAFNDIDNRSGGVWKLKGSTVVIDWISGWRSSLSLDPATPLRLRHWAPGSDRNGPPSGGDRQGRRIE